MRITDVRTVLLTGPCTDDPWLSVFKQSRSAAFCEVETDQGTVGVGETYVGYFFPESVPLVVAYVREILINAEAFEPEELDVTLLTRRMRTCCQYWARTGLGAAALTGVEAALWDLKGKLLGRPVHELLRAGRRGNGSSGAAASVAPDSLPAYATGGPSPWPRTDLFAKIDFYRSLGFDAVKIASGYLDSTSREEVPTHGSIQAAVELEAGKLAALRDHAGSELGILLDGHMGHREGPERWDLDTATAVLTALAPYEVFFFEEPLPYADAPAWAALAEASPITVAGGEQLSTLDEFTGFHSRGAFGIAQPDAAWLGVADFVAVADLWAGTGGRVAPHAWGAGAAVMQNLHAAFAVDNTAIVELPPAAGPLHRELWTDNLVLRDGAVLRPEAPGLGITLDESIKERFVFSPGAEEFSSVPGKLMRS